MPKCKEGYISYRVESLFDDYFGGRGRATVVSVAMSLAENIRGSSDWMSDDAQKAAAEIILFYLDHWIPNKDEIDDTIHSFISTVVSAWGTKNPSQLVELLKR